MKKNIKTIFNAVELYLPMAAFASVFISYIIMILYRYLFRSQMAEVYELNAISFVWCATLAASYATRNELHIRFEMLYERLNEKKKLVIRLIGNLFVLILFSILLPYAYKAVIFQGIKSSSILGISFTIIYFPFVILTVLTIIHHAVSVIKDIKMGQKMQNGEKKK